MEEQVNRGEHQADYFEPYSHFARTLRFWFVAYGVGAPVALFSNEWLLKKLTETHKLGCVAKLFLIGMGIQIVMALVWRTSMWYQYIASDKPVFKKTCRYKASLWLSEQYWLEVIPDLSTLGLFGWATITAVSVACA